jgi:hypothetical protein
MLIGYIAIFAIDVIGIIPVDGLLRGQLLYPLRILSALRWKSIRVA